MRQHSILIVLFVAVAAPPAGAQAVKPLPAALDCPKCTIELSNPVRIGDRNGPGAFTASPYGSQHSIAVDGSENAYVGLRDGPSYAPWHFNATTGSYVGRVGKVGGRHGFEFPSLFHVLRGDSLLVLDENSSYSIMAPKSLRWVRGGSILGTAFDFIPLGTGSSFVVNARIRAPATVGYPLHIFDDAGNLMRSFGVDTAREDPRNDLSPVRVLASSGDTAFWAALHAYQYRLDYFTNSGTRRFSLTRNVAWYPHWTVRDIRRPTPSVKPMHFTVAAREMSDGLLWVAVIIPADNWADGLTLKKGMDAPRDFYDIADWSLAYDTMLEIIDPRRQVVVASSRLDAMVYAILPDQRVATLHADGGQPFLNLWKARLNKPR